MMSTHWGLLKALYQENAKTSERMSNGGGEKDTGGGSGGGGGGGGEGAAMTREERAKKREEEREEEADRARAESERVRECISDCVRRQVRSVGCVVWCVYCGVLHYTHTILLCRWRMWCTCPSCPASWTSSGGRASRGNNL
jgi:hypothetical protein